MRHIFVICRGKAKESLSYLCIRGDHLEEEQNEDFGSLVFVANKQ